MSRPDDPPPPHVNATIQLDALDANLVELESGDAIGVSGSVKPPPLPPEALAPPPPEALAPQFLPGSSPVPAPAPLRSRKTAFYALGFVLLLGAAIYGGLRVGAFAHTAPAPKAIASVAPPAPTASASPAASASEVPQTITIPTIEVR